MLSHPESRMYDDEKQAKPEKPAVFDYTHNQQAKPAKATIMKPIFRNGDLVDHEPLVAEDFGCNSQSDIEFAKQTLMLQIMHVIKHTGVIMITGSVFEIQLKSEFSARQGRPLIAKVEIQVDERC